MKTARNIGSIISLLLFGLFLYMAFVKPMQLKKQAFKSGFNGIVISTLEGQGRVHRITVEILNGESRCNILISPITERTLYPQYRDSIFKKSESDIIFLKKDQSTEILEMDGINCLDIDCPTKKKTRR